jgi:hypothetical protein
MVFSASDWSLAMRALRLVTTATESRLTAAETTVLRRPAEMVRCAPGSRLATTETWT